MTGAQLKEALLRMVPVRYNGIDYDRVSAIIYRNRGGSIVVSAELADKDGRSCVVIAPADKVEER